MSMVRCGLCGVTSSTDDLRHTIDCAFHGDRMINIADIVGDDGLTHRERNMQVVHEIPIGALVELTEWEDDDRHDGVRMYVVYHHRDCDGTPLYALSADRDDTNQCKPGLHNRTWFHGISAGGISVVMMPVKRRCN